MTATDPRRWTQRRPLDRSERQRRFGALQPMPRPSLVERIFGQR